VARDVSLLELRDRVRRHADVRSVVRWTDAIINDLIDEAVPELQDLILSENDTYNIESYTFGIVSGTDTYGLPAEFYKMKGVDILDSQGDWRPIERFSWGDRLTQSEVSTSRTDLMYKVLGPSIVFHVEPGWTQAAGCRLWYWPVLADLVNDGDTINGHNGWDKFIVFKVAMEILQADKRDATTIAALLGQQDQRVRKAAAIRDRGNPPVVRDVRNRFARPYDRLPRPR